MDHIPKEILTFIINDYCSTDKDIKSNQLLVHLRDEKWQIELITRYYTICQVSKEWDKIVCNNILLPYLCIKIEGDKPYKKHKFERIECVYIISTGATVPILESLTLNQHTKYIVWSHKLEFCPNIMSKIKDNKLTIIGYRTYGELIAEYLAEYKNSESIDWIDKYVPHHYQGLIELNAVFIAYHIENPKLVNFWQLHDLTAKLHHRIREYEYNRSDPVILNKKEQMMFGQSTMPLEDYLLHLSEMKTEIESISDKEILQTLLKRDVDFF